jgi:hypothetical protein
MSASLDAVLIAAGHEFFEKLTEYDRVTDWVSVESATLVRRLGEVKELIFLHSPPQTFAGAAVQLRCLREMILRDWDDYLVEAPPDPAVPARKRLDAPVLLQIIALLEREAGQ